jgi:hypothetical protein
MKGLLNGLERFELGDGLILQVSEVRDSTPGSPPSFVLKCSNHYEQWTTELGNVTSDPTSPHVDSAHRDLLVALWGADVIVVAGDPAAFVLKRSTGTVVHRLALDFTGLSADVMMLRPEPSMGRFVIVSSRRLWVLDTEGNPVFRYEPEGPIARYGGISGDTLKLGEYDLGDPTTPIVERLIEIE